MGRPERPRGGKREGMYRISVNVPRRHGYVNRREQRENSPRVDGLSA